MKTIYKEELDDNYIRDFGKHLGNDEAVYSHEWDDGFFLDALPASCKCKICGAKLEIIQQEESGINLYYSNKEGFTLNTPLFLN